MCRPTASDSALRARVFVWAAGRGPGGIAVRVGARATEPGGGVTGGLATQLRQAGSRRTAAGEGDFGGRPSAPASFLDTPTATQKQLAKTIACSRHKPHQAARLYAGVLGQDTPASRRHPRRVSQHTESHGISAVLAEIGRIWTAGGL